MPALNKGGHAQCDDGDDDRQYESRRRPSPLGSERQAQRQARQRKPECRRPWDIEPPGLGTRGKREHSPGDQETDKTERQVDEENPTPAQAPGDETAPAG